MSATERKKKKYKNFESMFIIKNFAHTNQSLSHDHCQQKTQCRNTFKIDNFLSVIQFRVHRAVDLMRRHGSFVVIGMYVRLMPCIPIHL